jgi:hypothetical protein
MSVTTGKNIKNSMELNSIAPWISGYYQSTAKIALLIA